MQDNEKHENEASKKRKLDEKINENNYTRKLRKQSTKQPRCNEVKQRITLKNLRMLLLQLLEKLLLH